MRPYFISLIAGIAVGLFYGLMGVRSPAPPAIALLGLLGMLAGEQLVPMMKSHVLRPGVQSSADLIAPMEQVGADIRRKDAQRE